MAKMKLLDCRQISFFLLSGPLLEMWLHLKLLYSNAVILNIGALKKKKKPAIIPHYYNTWPILCSLQLHSQSLLYPGLSIRQVLVL